MRATADCLLAAWTVLNVILTIAARRAPLVAAVFATAAILSAAGLLAASPLILLAGLAASVVAPVLYGQRIAGQNHLSHHLVRAGVVIALLVLYWLS